MHILVTGAAGLVGRQLLPRLEREGHDAMGCDVAGSGCEHEVDVANPVAFGALVDALRPEAIVHLAAISATRTPEDDPAQVFRVNFGGVQSVLAAVRERVPAARLLLVSSGLIYGCDLAEGEAFDETAPFRPRGAYGWSKAAGDRLASLHAEQHGLDVVRVRPFNHTGPGRRDDFVEARLARQIAAVELGIQPPFVDALNVEGTRDFLAVEDVIDAYAKLLAPSVPAGTYNIASGQGVRIREVFDRLLAGSTAEAELRVAPEQQDPSDRSVGNAQRLRDATGWAPHRDLDETLGRLLESWRRTLRDGAVA